MIPKTVVNVLNTEKEIKIDKGPQSSDVFSGPSRRSGKGYMQEWMIHQMPVLLELGIQS